MLRLLLGLGVVTLLAVSCSGEDEKRRVRESEAGAGGESGAAEPSAGGSETDPTVAGAAAGGELGVGGGGGGGDGTPQAEAGAPASGAPNATAGQGSGGVASEPAAGAAGRTNAAGAAGAAGATSGVISQFCADPNQYYVGEGACAPCEGEPTAVQQTCVEAFAAKSLLSDGEPIAILLTPIDYPREPLPAQVDIAYLNPNLTLPYELKLDFATGRYDIDIQSGPDNPSEVIVEPFKIQGVCGDTFELTDGVRFLHSSGDNYVVTCPNQT